MPRYKGSFIAKQIEDDNRIYAHRRERALKIKALREQYEKRKRGESNERPEFSVISNETATRKERDSE